MLSSENQKSHPFGLAEKRFEWENNYSNGNDLKKHKKLLNKTKDNLEGGIGRFLNRIIRENEMEREREKNSPNNKYLQNMSMNSSVDQASYQYHYGNRSKSCIYYNKLNL